MGLVLFSLALGAGVVELTVRAALDVYRCDERMGWTFQRDRSGFKLNRMTNTLVSVRLDRHGFRGPDRPVEKAAGVHRMLILGDSFTAGLHVAEEDSYPARLETSLNSKSAPGARFEVINAGVPGYSTAQEMELFREIGWKQQPDLVVLAVYLGNDLGNNSIRVTPCHYLVGVCGRPYYEMREGRLVAIEGGKPLRVQSGEWLDRILGFSIVYRNFFHATGGAVSEEPPESQIVYGIESNTRGFPSWVATMELLVRLRKSVDVYGIPFVVLVVSTKPEVIASEGSLIYRVLRESFMAFLTKQGIPYIDPLADLARSQKAGRSPYYESDHHWNEAGHEIAANSLDAFFAQHCEDLGLPIEDCAAGRLPTEADPR